MRAMFLAFAATILIAVVGHYTLLGFGFSTADWTAADSVRLD